MDEKTTDAPVTQPQEAPTKKQLKKAYRKRKWRTIRPFKFFCIFGLVCAIITGVSFMACKAFDNSLAAFMGGNFTKIENEDSSAQYFTSDFNSPEETHEYGRNLVEQVEAEGATLLLNKDNTLPLNKGAAISLFSSSSIDLIYGGTGSGSIDASTAPTFQTALSDAGFKVNDALTEFYKVKGEENSAYKRVAGNMFAGTTSAAGDVPLSEYADELKGTYKQYGDAAIFVIGRVGGEGADLESQKYNYLALTQDEKDVLADLKAQKEAGVFKKIIVIINSANTVQLDFLKDSKYDVDSVLWIGDVGETGVNAVGKILNGDVNPSGSLVDTYCYDNYSSPAAKNVVAQLYGGDVSSLGGNEKYFIPYQEGIYVGYKYYETRYSDAVEGTGNTAGYKYDNDVAFPFGYGLSYTNFEYSNMQVKYDGTTDKYIVSVDVKNTGEKAGKEPVQIYLQSPYSDYDKKNGVEKAAVQLVGFGKTKELAPGESEILNIEVNRSDFASYDAYGKKTYILEDGDYYLTAATDAHSAANNILAAKGKGAANGMIGEGNASLVYKNIETKFDAETYSISKNGTKITNQLDAADLNLYDGADGQKITYVSRSDWEATMPKEALKLNITEKMKKDLAGVLYTKDDYDAAEMPTLGAKNGIKLVDMIGLKFDDPKWEELLDELTVDEMVTLITDDFHWTMPIESVQAPGTRDENGPQGLTASLMKSSNVAGTGFTSEDVMAATFNKELMAEIGKVIGNDCVNAKVAILYGPGNNTHRTPFGGRNFEYFSEDGFLAGAMSAPEMAAIEAKGVHVVDKHFAFNDHEDKRTGVCIWVNEQAAREIYLKAYQAPFEEAHAGGVMNSYTRIGTTWCGASRNLMNNILREEWGCNGFCITDNAMAGYMSGVDGVMAGTSAFDAMMPMATMQLSGYKKDPVVVNAMRKACHYNLYAVANSCGMNGIGANTTIKYQDIYSVTATKYSCIFFCVMFVGCGVMWHLRRRKFRETEEYKAWKAYKK